jgi:hypothetical protein
MYDAAVSSWDATALFRGTTATLSGKLWVWERRRLERGRQNLIQRTICCGLWMRAGGHRPSCIWSTAVTLPGDSPFSYRLASFPAAHLWNDRRPRRILVTTYLRTIFGPWMRSLFVRWPVSCRGVRLVFSTARIRGSVNGDWRRAEADR